MGGILMTSVGVIISVFTPFKQQGIGLVVTGITALGAEIDREVRGADMK